MKNILLVESSQTHMREIKTELEQQGFAVYFVSDPVEAILKFVKNRFNLVITGTEYETMTGMILADTLNRVDKHLIIFMIDPQPSKEREVEALRHNVSHYFPGDTEIDVILAYIRHFLGVEETDKPQVDQTLRDETDGIVIDVGNHQVYKDGAAVNVTRREYAILALLLKNKGYAVSREKIMTEIWGSGVEEISPRTIDGYVKKLRDKLDLTRIESVRGYGYRWL